MKKLLALVAVLLSLPATAEPPQELYIENEAGGVIAITLEDCAIDRFKKTYPMRAYATEGNGNKHEGCWFRPSIDDAPNDPNIRIRAVVNTIWDTGDRTTLMADLFHPKQEITIQAPPVIVTPENGI